jgi:hypothetical protein
MNRHYLIVLNRQILIGLSAVGRFRYTSVFGQNIGRLVSKEDHGRTRLAHQTGESAIPSLFNLIESQKATGLRHIFIYTNCIVENGDTDNL